MSGALLNLVLVLAGVQPLFVAMGSVIVLGFSGWSSAMDVNAMPSA